MVKAARLKNQLRPLFARLDHFILAEGDPRTLALTRILAGALVSWQLALLLPRFDLWFGENGWLNSVCTDLTRTASLSLLDGVQNSTAIGALLLLTLAASIGLSLGFMTRLSAIVAFVGVTSIQARANPILCGGDNVIQFVLFGLAVGRSGEAWSLDAWRGKRRGRSSRATIPLWPQRLIQVITMIIYLMACLHKLKDDCWIQGTAVTFSLQYEEFLNAPVPAGFREGVIPTLMTYWTLVIEFALGVILFLPRLARPIVLLSGVALHAGIAYLMLIPYFLPAMLVCYSAFLEPSVIEDGRRLWKSLITCLQSIRPRRIPGS